MLRVFIRTMHNRAGPEVASRELRWRDALVLVPFLGVIGLFAALPADRALARAAVGDRVDQRRRDRRARTTHPRWPADDGDSRTPPCAARDRTCSPRARTSTTRRSRRFEALLGGSVARAARRAAALAHRARAGSCRCSRCSRSPAPSRVTIWQWNDHVSAIAGRARARRSDAGADHPLHRRRRRRGAALLARAGAPRVRPRRVPLAAARLDRRHVDPRRGAEPDHAVHRHRAAVDPALRAVRDGDAPRRPRWSRG